MSHIPYHGAVLVGRNCPYLQVCRFWGSELCSNTQLMFTGFLWLCPVPGDLIPYIRPLLTGHLKIFAT